MCHFLASISLCLTLTGVVLGYCPDAWMSFRGSCYYFGHSDLTFQEAEDLCVHHGAHLVHIDDAVENLFIKSFLGDLKDPRHWIGLRDEVVEGLWAWYDTNTITNFTDWGVGQPDQGKAANCAAIWSSYHNQWVDETCTDKLKALCEKKHTSHLRKWCGSRTNCF